MLLCISLVVLTATGCTLGTDEPTLKKIQRTERIKIGYANEAPYAYYDVYTGELTGEAPAIAKKIFTQMGVREVEGVLTEFSALIPGLKAGRFDIIAAGMYITPKRCKEVIFSDPTYGLGEQLLVKKGNPLNLHSLDDIRENPKAILGLMSGAIEVSYANDAKIPRSRVKLFPDNPSSLAGLESGRIHTVMATSLTLKSLLKITKNDELVLAKPFHPPMKNGVPRKGYGAFAFRKEDKAFRDAFNKHLREFIGTEEHLKTVKPFGFGKMEMPGDMRAETLCHEEVEDVH